MLRVAIITADDRTQFHLYDRPQPLFGTAPAALINGFKNLPDVELHVISCATRPVKSPTKLADNVWFHQAIVNRWGWGRSLFLGCTLSVRQLLQTIEPDIVHGQGTERNCAIAATFSGYPNLITIHGNMRVHAKRSDNGNKPYYLLASILETICLKKTDGVVAISKYTKELIEDIAPTSWIVPNAVDARYFGVEHQDQDIPRILFVGSLNPRKNPVGLLRACRELLKAGTCRIAFAGRGDSTGDYMETFHKLAGDLPGVEILGHVNRDELKVELARSTMLVLPTFEDNCPMVLLEAMAAGIPVAASRVGGIPEIITHEASGLLFDPHNTEEIKMCIKKLIDDVPFREKLGIFGKAESMRRFHPDAIANKHIEIYREILATKKTKPRPFTKPIHSK